MILEKMVEKPTHPRFFNSIWVQVPEAQSCLSGVSRASRQYSWRLLAVCRASRQYPGLHGAPPASAAVSTSSGLQAVSRAKGRYRPPAAAWYLPPVRIAR